MLMFCFYSFYSFYTLPSYEGKLNRYSHLYNLAVYDALDRNAV